ncbi:carboxypeptidase-like regulatory domain-containing protein [Sphingobacterium corticibacter]|uniref:Outer membrane protein beta-barrel domain-containing protein n=1 Tax=Sphingobacterium corticibacter TaxID=2171749 RepID=A0A2T8HFE2_9SPHI|nr:carboxypeptidase-like regulatory domain-containing protein [Sphingobacterium corticibacter]PVH24158.1 hypothetical protein DC487_15600 [Sphingobacterium corticibacter]
MKYTCLSLLLLLNLSICHSQISLKGTITSERSQTSIFGATVQLKDVNTLKIISYSSSNADGYFEFKNIKPGQYRLEINHLTYHPYDEELTVSDDPKTISLTITLSESSKLLDEIVLQKSVPATMSGDTISYNLSLLTTGNEQKLKDVITRLPGLEINDNGKIMAHGKVINDLMVNGKKMFGDNHQLATENISAEMLDGIDLLNNHETFAAIKDIEGSDKTALNIKIKKEYLGKITGNLEAYGAYQNRYNTHANLFRFHNKSNIAAIVDLNNTGEQPLSLQNYLDMNKSIKQDMKNNDLSLSNARNTRDIPEFLLQNNEVASRNSQFASFDFIHQPTNKITINGFSIFNFSKTSESVLSEKIIFTDDASFQTLDRLSKQNGFFFNQTKLNLDYKPNDKSLFNYTIAYDPNRIIQDQFVDNELRNETTYFDENRNQRNYSFGHQFSYILRLDRTKLLSVNAFQDIKDNRENFDLSSNRVLFRGDENDLFQQNRIKKNEVGFFVKYTQKLNQHIARVNTGFVTTRQSFAIENLLNTEEKTTTNLGLSYGFVDGAIVKKEGLLQYQAKVEFRNSTIRSRNENIDQSVFQFLPAAELKIAFSPIHHLSAGYNRTFDFAQIENLNEVSYIRDFRTLISPSSIYYDEIFTQNTYSLNYLNINLYDGRVMIVNISRTYGNQVRSTNTINEITFNDVSYIVSPMNKSWSANLSFEQRVKLLKNKVKINLSYFNTETIGFINGVPNQNANNIYSIRPSFQSNFDQSYINYESGVKYSYQTFDFSLFDNRNTIQTISPFLNINGRWESQNIRYFIDNIFESYKSNAVTRNFYNLGAKIMYDKKSAKVKYWLQGVNILNINNPEIIKIASSNNIFSTDIIRRLAGYAGLGVSYEL